MRRDEREQTLLRRNWFHILVALAGRDAHGSSIARDVSTQTHDGIRLWPATLYRTLDQMVDAGLLEELVGDRHPEGVTERRRYFRASAGGRQALLREADRMSRWATTARRRLRRTS